MLLPQRVQDDWREVLLVPRCEVRPRKVLDLLLGLLGRRERGERSGTSTSSSPHLSLQILGVSGSFLNLILPGES